MKRITTALILASLLASLASCGGETPPVENGTTTDVDTTAAQPETTYTRETTPDSLPELDFKDAAVRIVYRGDETTQQM